MRNDKGNGSDSGQGRAWSGDFSSDTPKFSRVDVNLHGGEGIDELELEALPPIMASHPDEVWIRSLVDNGYDRVVLRFCAERAEEER